MFIGRAIFGVIPINGLIDAVQHVLIYRRNHPGTVGGQGAGQRPNPPAKIAGGSKNMIQLVKFFMEFGFPCG